MNTVRESINIARHVLETLPVEEKEVSQVSQNDLSLQDSLYVVLQIAYGVNIEIDKFKLLVRQSMDLLKQQKPKIRMYNAFYYDAVRKLIALARETQKNVEREYRDPRTYVDEYCTVRIQGPRGSGHSTTVNHLARLYDAMVVVPTLYDGDLHHKEWQKKCSLISLDRVRGVRADVVICDNVDELTAEQKALLYSMSVGKDTFVLVYVG